MNMDWDTTRASVRHHREVTTVLAKFFGLALTFTDLPQIVILRGALFAPRKTSTSTSTHRFV